VSRKGSKIKHLVLLPSPKIIHHEAAMYGMCTLDGMRTSCAMRTNISMASTLSRRRTP
jgi:hypothetical protein